MNKDTALYPHEQLREWYKSGLLTQLLLAVILIGIICIIGTTLYYSTQPIGVIDMEKMQNVPVTHYTSCTTPMPIIILITCTAMGVYLIYTGFKN